MKRILFLTTPLFQLLLWHKKNVLLTRSVERQNSFFAIKSKKTRFIEKKEKKQLFHLRTSALKSFTCSAFCFINSRRNCSPFKIRFLAGSRGFFPFALLLKHFIHPFLAPVSPKICSHLTCCIAFGLSFGIRSLCF